MVTMKILFIINIQKWIFVFASANRVGNCEIVLQKVTNYALGSEPELVLNSVINVDQDAIGII